MVRKFLTIPVAAMKSAASPRFGPRALGHRSLLAVPDSAKMRDRARDQQSTAGGVSQGSWRETMWIFQANMGQKMAKVCKGGMSYIIFLNSSWDDENLGMLCQLHRLRDESFEEPAAPWNWE